MVTTDIRVQIFPSLNLSAVTNQRYCSLRHQDHQILISESASKELKVIGYIYGTPSGLHLCSDEDIYKAKINSYSSSMTQQILGSLKYV